MSRDFDVGLLRTLVAVADDGSVTGAARRLNLTQAAVSLRIRRLEEAVGLRLLERHPRGVILSADGELLITPARDAVRMNDVFHARAAALTTPRAVRLGAPAILIARWLSPLLKNVAEAMPEVGVTLLSAPCPVLMDALGDGRIDMALVQQQVGGAQCGVRSGTGKSEVVQREGLVWVGAQGGAAWRREILPVIVPRPVCSYRATIVTALEQHGRRWEAVPDTESFDAVVALLRADLAIGAMQPSLVPVGLELLQAVWLPSLPTFETTLHQAGSLPPIAAAFARRLAASALSTSPELKTGSVI